MSNLKGCKRAAATSTYADPCSIFCGSLFFASHRQGTGERAAHVNGHVNARGQRRDQDHGFKNPWHMNVNTRGQRHERDHGLKSPWHAKTAKRTAPLARSGGYCGLFVSLTQRRFTGLQFCGSRGRTFTTASPAFLTSTAPNSSSANLSQAPVAGTLASSLLAGDFQGERRLLIGGTTGRRP